MYLQLTNYHMYMYLEPTVFSPHDCFPQWVIQQLSSKLSTWELSICELEAAKESPSHENHHCLCRMRYSLFLFANMLLKSQQMVVNLFQVSKSDHLPRMLIIHDVFVDMHLIQQQKCVPLTFWTALHISCSRKQPVNVMREPWRSFNVVGIVP